MDIAKSLFKCTRPLTKNYLHEVLTEWIEEQRKLRLKPEEHLNESAPGKSDAECIWRKSSWRWRHQKPVFQKKIHQKPRFFRGQKSIDKVQCTESTTTMSALVPANTNSAVCLLYTTRITATTADFIPYLREWIWNWFHSTILKSCKRSMVSNQLRSKIKWWAS